MREKVPIYVFAVSGVVTVLGEHDEQDAREVGEAYLSNLDDLDAKLEDIVDHYTADRED